MTTPLDVTEIRRRFPGLVREVAGRPACFFDGPAGSQVPQEVIDAVGHAMAHTNANVGGDFVTSMESDAVLDGARRAMADMFGVNDAREIVFGPNMTSLTFALAQSLAETWSEGDEIVVTRMDHDANVTPWVHAAQRAGVRVRQVRIRPSDATLDLDSLDDVLSPRTRLVAIGAASNLVGTINPVAEIARRGRAVGALTFVDAVHLAPHRLMDVPAWECDFAVCSAYKFFGPHVGVLWGRAVLLAELPAAKVRPASDEIPFRWMNGTQNHEGMAGTLAAVDYIAGLGGGGNDRRAALSRAFDLIERHERGLARTLLAGLAAIDGVRVWGLDDPERAGERTPTVAFTRDGVGPRELARRLAENGVFAWSGNNYALSLTEDLGLEPAGAVRVGILHYNTDEEVRYLLDVLART